MQNSGITYHRASTNEELNEILKLQEQNLREVLSDTEKEKEGFVTLKHSFSILKQMNDKCAHCIAKSNNKVIGYALSMVQDFKNDIPILEPMFIEIDKALSQQKIAINYIAMGQICVDKDFRGKGVFRGLYHFMGEELKSTFDAIVTEVDSKNIRSSNAHKAVGFELFKKYTSNDQDWELIILNLK